MLNITLFRNRNRCIVCDATHIFPPDHAKETPHSPMGSPRVFYNITFLVVSNNSNSMGWGSSTIWIVIYTTIIKFQVLLDINQDRDGAMFGHCNPVAPPMGLRWEEEVARCTMAFGLRHGGAPGIVHGGLIAAALDQVSGYCATMAGRSGLTIRLNTRYRRAVPVGLELEFDARVVEQTERATEIHARCVAADVVYAESTGTFARMDRERMRAVLGGA